MGKAKDQTELDAYVNVLETLGGVTDYIKWKPLPLEWLSKNLSGVQVRLVHQLMMEHVKAGGDVDQVEEKRPEYLDWRFHYDLRLSISGRRIYIETVFIHEPDPDDCTIWVVNMHDV